MKSAQIKSYAQLLCDYCLAIQEGDRVLVKSTYLAEELLQHLQEEISKRGAFSYFQTAFKHQAKHFFLGASDHVLENVSPFDEVVSKTANKVLHISAPFDTKALKDIPGSKKTTHTNAQAALKKQTMDRAAKGDLSWAICVFPTDAAATEARMSIGDYTDFVCKACFLDKEDPIAAWKNLGKEQQAITDTLNTFSEFQYVGSHHTDIRFSTKGRTWINSDGKRNMPSGEMFTSPVEDSVNGEIYFNYPTMYQGQDVEGIRLVVKDGVVDSWTAAVGQDALDQAFQIPGSRVFGEVAIGNNYNIQTAIKQILFDEKIGGSIHMAVGASYKEAGGKNESALHWDMIKDMTDGGKIYADGRLIYEDGRFLV